VCGTELVKREHPHGLPGGSDSLVRDRTWSFSQRMRDDRERWLGFQGEMAMTFVIKDCALIPISTGMRASNLSEFKFALNAAPPECIYHHFWGALLQSRFDDPEYKNDFAVWVYRDLRDEVLAELLAIIDPVDYSDLESLRSEIIELVEQRIEQKEWLAWIPATRPFFFLRSQIVVFDTGKRAETVEELATLLPELSPGSVYYHVVDARRRFPVGLDDFSAWLEGLGPEYEPLRESLMEIDPYFGSLTDLRSHLCEAFNSFLEGKR